MCGIAGFFGDFSPEHLQAMHAAIAHRGPDDAGLWHDPNARVGFAHRRLAIIDLSPRGHQPMWDATHRAIITFNGEIYNYRELKRELEADGFAFHSECDTEVILNLYLRDGPACLPRLNGIFAFALWDSRRRELVLARDGLGVKPLYYTQTNRGWLFASELKALLKVPGVDKALDFQALGCYLTFLYSPSPHTMLRAVRKLLPGHALTIPADGAIRSWRFYELPYDQPIARMSAVDAMEETRNYIRQAVRRQMVADVPVGAFLSGGLDSSSVAAFAQESLGDQRLACFTIGFNDAPPDIEGMVEDLPYARKVAEHLGVDLKTIYVSPTMGDDLEQMVYQLDEPQADPAALNTFYISRLARENGIKVLLSGAGGDDIFTGYRRHHALMLERYWAWLPAPMRHVLRDIGAVISKGTPSGRRFAKAFQYAHLSGDPRIAGYFQWIAPEVLRDLFGPSWDESLRHEELARLMLETLAGLPAGVPPLNRMLYLDTKYFLADHNLNYTDKMSMAAGVEVRVPLLDYDLVAFAARLPVEFKQHGPTGKWIFKKAMEQILPADVIYRPKTGFGVPLRVWLRGKLRDILDDYLSEESVKRRGIFAAAGVRHLIEQDRAGRIDAAYNILALACVEIWLRKFVD
jgi:asparagine synthase (glutamine-hydrolysing)